MKHGAAREEQMTISRKFQVLAACVALFAAPALGFAEDTKNHRRHFVRKQASCPLHRNAEGELVDCRGWRKRDTAIGWDNSCFNLDYLPSMYACSAKGRR
jgi:hypothetical protein